VRTTGRRHRPFAVFKDPRGLRRAARARKKPPLTGRWLRGLPGLPRASPGLEPLHQCQSNVSHVVSKFLGFRGLGHRPRRYPPARTIIITTPKAQSRQVVGKVPENLHLASLPVHSRRAGGGKGVPGGASRLLLSPGRGSGVRQAGAQP